MKNEINDVLHLYLGCEVESTAGRNLGKLVGVGVNQVIVNPLDKFDPKTTIIKYVKPILRQLSDMTEEEAIDIYTIERDTILHKPTHDVDFRKAETDIWEITRLDILNETLMIGFYGEMYKVIEDNETGEKHMEPLRNVFHITAYLLSKGFDLFNLIPRGLAIDKSIK